MADVAQPATLEEVPAYVEATAPVVEDQLSRLQALERPGDERIGDYLVRVEQILRSSRDLAAAAERGHEAEARAAGQRTQALTREARALARELGAEECASQ